MATTVPLPLSGGGMDDSILQTLFFNPSFNAALQGLGGRPFDAFFIAVTALGYMFVLLPLLTALYWGWDKRNAFMIIQLVAYSGLLNHMLKEVFQMPRPFQVAPEQVRLIDLHMRNAMREGTTLWAVPSGISYSFPSGHAQVAVCLWGGLAWHFRRHRGVPLAGAVLILLISLSRIYLGVHFLGDVLVGLTVGGALLWLYVLIARYIDRHPDRPTSDMRSALGVLLPVLCFWLVPDSRTALFGGILAGLTVGYALEKNTINFSTAGAPRRRIVRILVGFAAVILLGGVIFRGHDLLGQTVPPYPLMVTAAQFFALSLGISFLVPALLVALRLAPRVDSNR